MYLKFDQCSKSVSVILEIRGGAYAIIVKNKGLDVIHPNYENKQHYQSLQQNLDFIITDSFSYTFFLPAKQGRTRNSQQHRLCSFQYLFYGSKQYWVRSRILKKGEEIDNVSVDSDEFGGHSGGFVHRSLPSHLQELLKALQVRLLSPFPSCLFIFWAPKHSFFLCLYKTLG